MVPLLIGAQRPGLRDDACARSCIYEGAFLSEVVRGGIVALGRGQMEAARALGHSYLGAMLYVILPQALYNVLPSILSQFVSDHQGDHARLRHQRAGAHFRGQPDQQPAADQAFPGLLHPGASSTTWSAGALTRAATALERRIAAQARRPARRPAARPEPQPLRRPSHDPESARRRTGAPDDQLLERQQVATGRTGARSTSTPRSRGARWSWSAARRAPASPR